MLFFPCPTLNDQMESQIKQWTWNANVTFLVLFSSLLPQWRKTFQIIIIITIISWKVFPTTCKAHDALDWTVWIEQYEFATLLFATLLSTPHKSFKKMFYHWSVKWDNQAFVFNFKEFWSTNFLQFAKDPFTYYE